VGDVQIHGEEFRHDNSQTIPLSQLDNHAAGVILSQPQISSSEPVAFNATNEGFGGLFRAAGARKMLMRVCHRAGAVFAAIWLASSAIAAPVKFSDEPDFSTISPASPTVIDVIIPSGLPAPSSVFTDAPPLSKSTAADDALDVAGGAVETGIPIDIDAHVFSAPVVANSEPMSVQVASRVAVDRGKSQDSATPAAQPLQPSPNFVARQQSSPLVIATPEPGSVGLLLMASASLLMRRRSRG
jgi:hypothetical protein